MASPDRLSSPFLRPRTVVSCTLDGRRRARTSFVGVGEALWIVVLWPSGFQRGRRRSRNVLWRREDVLLEGLLVHVPVDLLAVKRIDRVHSSPISRVGGNWRNLTDSGNVSTLR